MTIYYFDVDNWEFNVCRAARASVRVTLEQAVSVYNDSVYIYNDAFSAAICDARWCRFLSIIVTGRDDKEETYELVMFATLQ